ncbi:Pycsar system effector family protein [Ignavibacterium sp.]|uniref:Pycsar system effector family protein n=1 Tax=Ignavibacterium sp. TaxID=2651167 RepID=UPI00307DA328
MEEIINKSIEYVSNLLSQEAHSKLLFHNINHALEVEENVIEIGSNLNLTTKEIILLRLAAIFHDIGWIEKQENHELRSAMIAEKYLSEIGVDDEDVKIISNLIKITDIELMPNSILDKVIRDADILHIGKKGFNKKSQLLRAEKEVLLNKSFSDLEWLKKNLEFLETNNFYTEYAKQQYENSRQKNIIKIKNKIEDTMNNIDSLNEGKLFNEENKKIDKKKNASRGVETMFRNTIRTHVEFSSMADSKANILISVNTLLLTVVAAFLVKSLDTNTHLIIPTGVLVIVSLSSLIYAILVTRPKVTTGTFTKKDVEDKAVNLLFFGNFHKMDLKSFDWGMQQMINDSDYLYSKMIEDYFHLGCVLGEKYKLLRTAYTIFMYGMIISVITFCIAVIVSSGQTNLQF